MRARDILSICFDFHGAFSSLLVLWNRTTYTSKQTYIHINSMRFVYHLCKRIYLHTILPKKNIARGMNLHDEQQLPTDKNTITWFWIAFWNCSCSGSCNWIALDLHDIHQWVRTLESIPIYRINLTTEFYWYSHIKYETCKCYGKRETHLFTLTMCVRGREKKKRSDGVKLFCTWFVYSKYGPTMLFSWSTTMTT